MLDIPDDKRKLSSNEMINALCETLLSHQS